MNGWKDGRMMWIFINFLLTNSVKLQPSSFCTEEIIIWFSVSFTAKLLQRYLYILVALEFSFYRTY